MAQQTTQDFLKIDQIRDGVVILKNKGLRAVLMCSSLNFALKSDEEQEAIIYQFQTFLNSLDFSCQILVQSRKINITGYLEKLKTIEEKERNELLRIQISDYREFVASLVEGGSIMQKSFYVIVPFSPFETKKMGEKSSGFSKSFSFTEEKFQRAKIQLMQRAEFVALSLRRCGIQAVPLNTIELIEFFWALHHPTESERGYYPELPIEIIEEMK